MARRADHSKQELVELVIAAARDLIVEEGIDKLSARALSKRIGYAPGTLYNHFRDLDDIVTAVNARTLAGLGAAFAAAPPDADPRRRLHNLADAYVGYVAANARLWEALFEFKRAEGVPVPDWYRDTIEALARGIGPAFQALRPSASAEAAAEAGKLVFASIHSVSSLQSSGRLAILMDQDIHAVVHKLVDIHLTAFAAG